MCWALSGTPLRRRPSRPGALTRRRGLAAGVVGLVAGMLALVGDLSMSMLKRQVGVKDSGWLFPGHGGMLDRLDSILFVIPFVYMVVSTFSIR